MKTDKLAEKILEQKFEYLNIIYPDDLQLPIIINSMQAYHDARLKEELIKYQEYLRKNGYPGLWEDEIDEYLKTRNNENPC